LVTLRQTFVRRCHGGNYPCPGWVNDEQWDRSIDGGVTCRPRASQVPCRRRKIVSGSLTSLTKLQADPPDVLLETVNGGRVGIEVTELLDPDAAKRHSYRKKRGDPPAYDSAPWTPTKMAKTLSGIIGVKDHKLGKVAGGFDECFLAIVTD